MLKFVTILQKYLHLNRLYYIIRIIIIIRNNKKYLNSFKFCNSWQYDQSHSLETCFHSCSHKGIVVGWYVKIWPSLPCLSPSGYEISGDIWPRLITVTEGEDSSTVSMSWFVPPGTKIPENTDESVTLQSRPEATVYVRWAAVTFNSVFSWRRSIKHLDYTWKQFTNY